MYGTHMCVSYGSQICDPYLANATTSSTASRIVENVLILCSANNSLASFSFVPVSSTKGLSTLPKKRSSKKQKRMAAQLKQYFQQQSF